MKKSNDDYNKLNEVINDISDMFKKNSVVLDF